MSARIVQVDLGAPLQAIYTDRAGETLMLLVKFGLQPLGWVKCAVAARVNTITPDQLGERISQSLSLQVHDAARQRLFELRDPRPHIAATDSVLLLSEDVTVDTNFQAVLAESYADSRVQCVFGDIWPSTFTNAVQAELERDAPLHQFQPRTFTPLAWNTLFTRKSAGYGPGIALSVRRATFETVGGFDPALRGEPAKWDLITRILRSGGTVVHDPRAICFQQRRRRDAFAQSFDQTAYCAKYFRDAELANSAVRIFRRSLRDAVCGFEFSRLAGAMLGVRAYRRARRRVHKQSVAQKVTLKKAA